MDHLWKKTHNKQLGDISSTPAGRCTLRQIPNRNGRVGKEILSHHNLFIDLQHPSARIESVCGVPGLINLHSLNVVGLILLATRSKGYRSMRFRKRFQGAGRIRRGCRWKELEFGENAA